MPTTMKTRTKLWLFAAILIIGIIAWWGWMAFSRTSNDDHAVAVEAEYIPQAPDYDDATMWVTADGDSLGTGADIFYVVSTWEEDWTTAVQNTNPIRTSLM